MAEDLFDHKRRVQLFYVLMRLLPPARLDGYGQVGGESLHSLDEMLRMELGLLSLGSSDIEKAFQVFIVNKASEEQLYTLIRLIPAAHVQAARLEGMRGGYPRFSPRDLDRDLGRIIDALNVFLQTIGSPARFDQNGNLVRGGVTADSQPKELTELPNRSDLLSDLGKLTEEGTGAGVLFIDLDNFKQVNDLKGHPAGDACLVSLVRLIGNSVRLKGKLFRYGGDEFAVVLPNAHASEAAATAERIRADIDRDSPGLEIKVTASIGVAASSAQDLATAETLIGAADRAMYVSKYTGKNRVTVWPILPELMEQADANREKKKGERGNR